MNIRRLSALVVALAAATVVSACSGGTNTGSGTTSTTLTLASVDQGSIEDVVKAFEAANPGVKVNFTTSGADQYQQQIRTQLASGTAPDVMTVWPGNGNPGATYVLAKPGYLMDLSDQPWAAKLPAGLKGVAQYQGKTYNAVFGVNGIGAIYNQQAIDKAGLTPPNTWTELLAFCRAAAAKGTPAFALGNQDNWVTQIVLYALDGLPSFPGLAPDALAGTVSLTPDLRTMERAADAAKYRGIADRPHVELSVPSLLWPGLAPQGRHVLVARVHYVPYAATQALDGRVDAAIDAVSPGFASRVLHRVVWTPRDLEERFGLRGGAATQGELALDQILFMRPVAGWGRHATPIGGLFLGGAGTHPGPGILGGAGWLAAERIP